MGLIREEGIAKVLFPTSEAEPGRRRSPHEWGRTPERIQKLSASDSEEICPSMQIVIGHGGMAQLKTLIMRPYANQKAQQIAKSSYLRGGSNFSSGANPPEDEALKLFNRAARYCFDQPWTMGKRRPLVKAFSVTRRPRGLWRRLNSLAKMRWIRPWTRAGG